MCVSFTCGAEADVRSFPWLLSSLFSEEGNCNGTQRTLIRLVCLATLLLVLCLFLSEAGMEGGGWLHTHYLHGFYVSKF